MSDFVSEHDINQISSYLVNRRPMADEHLPCPALHLSNQLSVATRVTCTDTLDCFKRTLKASLFSCSLEWASHLCGINGGYSKVYNININMIISDIRQHIFLFVLE